MIDKSSTGSVIPFGLFDVGASLPHAPTRALVSPLKWHGGKHYLRSDIVALMPPRCRNPNKPDPDDPGWTHYVEPYAGGLCVLLANDPEGISEVVNDLDGRLTNFWDHIKDPDLFAALHRRLQATPFSEVEYQRADGLDDAASFFIHNRQSLAGRMDGFTSRTRCRTRRGMNAETSAWMSVIDKMPEVCDRLRRVLILNRPAVDVITAEDTKRTLFYLDPPYLHETRVSTDVYGVEMTEADHRELLETIRTVAGKVILSGYRSDLYDRALADWKRHDFNQANNAAGGATKKRMIECLWCNF